jgi:hypothetical protein
MKRLLSTIMSLTIVITLLILFSVQSFAATQNAELFQSGGGAISLTGAGSIALCVATPDDEKFVQMGPGSWIIMKFPGNYAAVPDGTSAPDLRVDTYDVPFPADAEISVSLNGTAWIVVGTYADTANIDLDLEVNGPVKYVKINQGANYIDPAYPTLGFDLDAVVALNAGVIPYGTITSPSEGQVLVVGINPADGLVNFDAVYWDDDFDAVQWAVRKDTSASGAPNVWGNVDGRNDPFTWDGHLFHSQADVSDWAPAVYYAFVWNPTNDAGEPDIRLIRSFRIDAWPTVSIGGPYLTAVNSTISVAASGSDPDGDALDFTWDLDNDGFFDDGTGTTTDYIAGSVPGIYTIQVKATDPYDAYATAETTVVVYDPNGGFVTGGGWIMSPAGAYAADPLMAGKASFGFVCKYLKGATVPTGNTEFQFKAGDLNFNSTSYEFLVVAGSKAIYKGEGTINGLGTYHFMLTANDGGKTGLDTFRIKIWVGEEDGSVVYDNGVEAAISGGSIIVHK